MQPLIVMSAPNGARRTKTDHPNLPITPDELAAEAVLVADAGATLFHLHVRDEGGGHSLDPDRYRKAIDVVREAVGERLVIQITTEAVGRYGPDEQIAVVRELRPSSVSLAIRELVPSDGEDDLARGRAFFEWLREEGIAPHYILYSADDVHRFETLRAYGVIPQKNPLPIFVLGRYVDPAEVTPNDLLPFLKEHDEHAHWSICAFGPVECAASLTAIALGGHVRVGFENNLWHADGRLAANNAELIEQVVDGARLIDRPIANIDETRSLLAETAK